MSLRRELREKQRTPEEKCQHEARGRAEYDDRCEVCVRVREQWCDNDVAQVNIDLRHRVTELQDENRKLKQQVGELKRIEQKVRDEKKAALKAKTLEFHQEPDWQLAAGTERCRSDLAGAREEVVATGGPAVQTGAGCEA